MLCYSYGAVRCAARGQPDRPRRQPRCPPASCPAAPRRCGSGSRSSSIDSNGKRIGRQIVEAYKRMPQTEEELAGIDDAIEQMISRGVMVTPRQGEIWWAETTQEAPPRAGRHANRRRSTSLNWITVAPVTRTGPRDTDGDLRWTRTDGLREACAASFDNLVLASAEVAHGENHGTSSARRATDLPGVVRARGLPGKGAWLEAGHSSWAPALRGGPGEL